MPFKGDPAQHLADIEESIALVLQFVGAMTLDEYAWDRKTQDAVERRLLIITEAAKRLGEDAERLAPEIPWGEVRGLGN